MERLQHNRFGAAIKSANREARESPLTPSPAIGYKAFDITFTIGVRSVFRPVRLAWPEMT